MNDFGYDAAVYSPDQKIQLIAEVKAKRGATQEWATQMRRNLLVHQAIGFAPFFLLALPDHFYLWRDGSVVPDEKLPDYSAETEKLLSPYLNSAGLSLNNLSGQSFELVVIAWLRDLVHSRLSKDSVTPEQQWLIDSGLFQAIKDGSVVTPVAA